MCKVQAVPRAPVNLFQQFTRMDVETAHMWHNQGMCGRPAVDATVSMTSAECSALKESHPEAVARKVQGRQAAQAFQAWHRLQLALCNAQALQRRQRSSPLVKLSSTGTCTITTSQSTGP